MNDFNPLEYAMKMPQQINKSLNDVTPDEWEALRRAPEQRALDRQVAGTHYKKFKIQPAEFCYVNDIPYLEATAIKYLCRWKDKGGIQDLEKARHYIDLLIEFTEVQSKNESTNT